MLCGTKGAQFAGFAVVLVSLAGPAIAGNLRVGSAATLNLGMPSTGATGGDLGTGVDAGPGASLNGGTDPAVGADAKAQAATPAPTFQSSESSGAVPLGLDRFKVQSEGKSDVRVFYKFMKGQF